MVSDKNTLWRVKESRVLKYEMVKTSRKIYRLDEYAQIG